MNGIGPELPLSRDVRAGTYTLVTSYKEEARQNFKNLLLTSPGERIMDPNFGVGLRNFLFENSDDFTSNDIESKIREQIDIYLPFIDILRINIINAQNAGPLFDLGVNTISVSIEYHIEQISTSDTLDIKF